MKQKEKFIYWFRVRALICFIKSPKLAKEYREAMYFHWKKRNGLFYYFKNHFILGNVIKNL